MGVYNLVSKPVFTSVALISIDEGGFVLYTRCMTVEKLFGATVKASR